MANLYYKQLYTKMEGGALPQLVSAESEYLQSRFVVQRVLELREEGVPLEEIAVLFRSSYLSFDLELELAKANIPFRKFGGFKFIETAHVKDMVAYLRVLENPRDAVSWNRILLLIDGVGPRTSEKIIDDILSHRLSSTNKTTRSFWTAFSGYSSGVQKLFSVLGEAQEQFKSPGEKAYHLRQYYEPFMRTKYDDHDKRRKDLEMFQTIAERYNSVNSMLTDMALEPPNESVTDMESPGPETEYLTLSTIHSAKGLEWHSVFVIHALDGRFPTLRAAEDPHEMEEERRLMYVAITRAKRNLAITYPVNMYDHENGVVLSKPSRFLDEIGPELLEPWVISDED